jgi:hypothetical protein
VGWSGIRISSFGEEIVKDFQRNTKIPQIAERDAENRVHNWLANMDKKA